MEVSNEDLYNRNTVKLHQDQIHKTLEINQGCNNLITKQISTKKKKNLLNPNKRTELVALFLALLLFPILHGSLRAQKS